MKSLQNLLVRLFTSPPPRVLLSSGSRHPPAVVVSYPVPPWLTHLSHQPPPNIMVLCLLEPIQSSPPLVFQEDHDTLRPPGIALIPSSIIIPSLSSPFPCRPLPGSLRHFLPAAGSYENIMRPHTFEITETINQKAAPVVPSPTTSESPSFLFFACLITPGGEIFEKAGGKCVCSSSGGRDISGQGLPRNALPRPFINPFLLPVVFFSSAAVPSSSLKIRNKCN